MTFRFSEINFAAVFSAAFLAFMIGGVWYTALFGKQWRDLQGFSEEKLKEMKTRRPPPVFFGGMIVCYLVLALVLAILIGALADKTAASGAVLGFLVWLGPAAAVGMTNWIASDKPIGAFLIDAGCALVYLVLMGSILGAWRS
jgi:Protein of unknown function (DUF1761)